MGNFSRRAVSLCHAPLARGRGALRWQRAARRPSRARTALHDRRGRRGRPPLARPAFALWGDHALAAEQETWPIEGTALALRLRRVDAAERVGRRDRRKAPWWALGIAAAVHAVLLIIAFALPPTPIALAYRANTSIADPPRQWAVSAWSHGAWPGATRQPIPAAKAGRSPARPAKGRAHRAARRRKATTSLGLRHRRRPVAVPDATAVARALVQKLTLSTGTDAALASVFGQKDALGADPTAALRGLSGSPLAEGYGLSGLALQGAGRGGGGTGAGAIKTSLRTTGGGTGYGVTCGSGYLRGGRRARARGLRGGCALGSIYGSGYIGSNGMDGPPIVVACSRGTSGRGCVPLQGNLDKELVRRVVRQHINEIRYCYQRELSLVPSLAGRVVVKFVIGAGDRVTSSRLSSPRSATPTSSAASCTPCGAGSFRDAATAGATSS